MRVLGEKKFWRGVALAGALGQLGLLCLVSGGCAGRSVKEQYEDRAKEIRDKYNAMWVPPSSAFVASSVTDCDEFIDKMKGIYKLWKPGDAGKHFCARKPSYSQRHDFESKIRKANNNAVVTIRNRRLARLNDLYQEELAKQEAKSSGRRDQEDASDQVGDPVAGGSMVAPGRSSKAPSADKDDGMPGSEYFNDQGDQTGDQAPSAQPSQSSGPVGDYE